MRSRILVLAWLSMAAGGPTDTLLVANKQDSTLQLVDVASGKTAVTLPTGVGPHEVAVSPDGKRAVISNYGNKEGPGNSLTVVDLIGRKVVRTIDLGEHRRPHGSAFLPDGKQLVVTVEASEAVLMVDIDAGKVTRVISTGQKGTHMVALGPGGKRAYTANIGSGTVSALDLVAGTLVKSAPAGAQCEAIAVSPDGREVWIGSNKEDVVRVLDATTLEEKAKLSGAGVPIRVTFTPDGGRALVANALGGKLQIVDALKRTVVKTIDFPEGAGPIGTLIDPDGKRAYVALSGQREVAIIELGSMAVVGKVAAGGGPDGMAYSRR